MPKYAGNVSLGACSDPSPCVSLAAIRVLTVETPRLLRTEYSERTARSIGQENLTKPEIATAVEAVDARAKRCESEPDTVLKF
jgi:hypothetical protein